MQVHFIGSSTRKTLNSLERIMIKLSPIYHMQHQRRSNILPWILTTCLLKLSSTPRIALNFNAHSLSFIHSFAWHNVSFPEYTIEHQDDVIKELPKMLESWSVECRLKVPKQFLEEQTTINLLQIKTNSGEFLSLKRQGKKIEFNYHSMNALFINPVDGWTHSETHEEHASLIINRKRTNTSHYELDWSINGKKSSHVSKSFEFTEVSFTSTKYHVLSTSVLAGTLSSNKQTPTETKDTVAIVTKLQENPDGKWVCVLTSQNMYTYLPLSHPFIKCWTC